jgi:hypothetical protein
MGLSGREKRLDLRRFNLEIAFVLEQGITLNLTIHEA